MPVPQKNEVFAHRSHTARRRRPRWLLPFAPALDRRVLEAAMDAAAQRTATLVVLLVAREQSLLPLCSEASPKQDHLFSAIQQPSWQHRVDVEWYELFTADLGTSLGIQMRELECQSLVLVRRGSDGIQMPAAVLEQVLLRPPGSLLFLSLPDETLPLSFRSRLLTWRCHFQRRPVYGTRG